MGLFDSFTAAVGEATKGLGDTMATLTVLSADTKARVVVLSPTLSAKVGRVIRRMQASKYDFTDSEIDSVIRALYVTQADEDFQAAFDMLTRHLTGQSTETSNPEQGEGVDVEIGAVASGLLAAEFREVLPLMGEDVSGDEIDSMFLAADSDGSGVIEFAEFRTLMQAMNPPDTAPAADFPADSGDFFGLGGAMSSFTGSLASNFTTMNVLSLNTQARLAGQDPLAMAKIGRIITAMKSAEEFAFTDEEVDLVVRAVYVTRSEADRLAAFTLLDKKLSAASQPQEFLSAESFKTLMPLLGEKLDADKVEDLFTEVDADGSGRIEFSEFKFLLDKVVEMEQKKN